MTLWRRGHLLAVAAVLVACNPVRVEVTQVEAGGPLIVFDVTNASNTLRDVRYEIEQEMGTSAGSTSAVECTRSFTELGHASRTIDLFVDGARIGSYDVTADDLEARYLVVPIRIGPNGGTTLGEATGTDVNPLRPLAPIPGGC